MVDTDKAPERKSSSRLKSAIKIPYRLFVAVSAAAVLIVAGIATFALPSSVWVATTSNDCPVYANSTGGTIVEVGDYVYVLGRGADSPYVLQNFWRYDPRGLNGGTGDCSPTPLADPPFSSLLDGANLVKYDDDTIYAYAGASSDSRAISIYKISADEWVLSTRAKADDSTTVETPLRQLDFGTEGNHALQMGNGQTIVAVNNEIYTTEGTAARFAKYRPATNTWTTLASNSNLSRPGNAMAAVGNTIYAMGGNDYNTTYQNFQSFDTTAPAPGSWVTLNTPPAPPGAGAAMVAIGTDIYVARGHFTTDFWKYDTVGGTWSVLGNIPEIMYAGASLAYPGIGDYIYATLGNRQKIFGSYCFQNTGSGCTVGTWAALASPPGYVGSGSGMVAYYDGSKVNIYLSAGGGSNEMWRYDVNNNRWNNALDGVIPPSLPVAVGMDNGGALNSDRGDMALITSGPSGGPEIYVAPGNTYVASAGQGFLFRYPLTGSNANTWPAIDVPVAPPLSMGSGGSIVYPGVSAEDPLGNVMYVLRGAASLNFWKFLISYNEWIPFPRSKILVNGDANTPLSQTISGEATFAQGTGNSVLEVGGLLYVIQGGSGASYHRFSSFNPATNTWKKLAHPPLRASQESITVTSMVSTDSDTIWAILKGNGENDRGFFKYSISKDMWYAEKLANLGTDLSPTPADQAPQYAESDVWHDDGVSGAVVNNQIYMTTNGSNFFRFNTNDNRWVKMMNIPSGGGVSGVSMTVRGTDIYVFVSSRGLIKYSTTQGTWTTLTAMPNTPNNTWGAGAALTYHPGTDKLYAFKGGTIQSGTTYTSKNREFWEYSATLDTWTQLNDTPQTVGGGADLLYHSGTPDYIYALGGEAQSNFWRYNVNTTVWSQLADTPFAVEDGGSLESDGSYVYATRGGGRKDFWRYSTTLNTWTVMPDAPTQVGQYCGGGGYTLCETDQADLVSISFGGHMEIWLLSGHGFSGSYSEWDGEGADAGLVYRYNPVDNKWPVVDPPAKLPNDIGSGAALAYPGSGNYLYVTNGLLSVSPPGTNGNRNLWVYNMTTNEWRSRLEGAKPDGSRMATDPLLHFNFSTDLILTDLPREQSMGSKIFYLAGKIFINASGTSHLGARDWLAYDPATDTWEQKQSPPASVGNHSSLTEFDSNTVYMKNSGAGEFMKYILYDDPPLSGDGQDQWISFARSLLNNGKIISHPFTDWAVLATGSPPFVYQSSGATVAQAGGKIYVYSGTASDYFYEFNRAGNTWKLLEDPPSTIIDLIAVNATTLYAIDSSTGIYKYEIPTNQWTRLPVTTTSAGAGASIVYYSGNNSIYRIRGAATTEVRRFDISTSAWDVTTITAPATIYSGGSSAIIGDNIYISRGGGSHDFWRYNITNNRWNNALDGVDPTNGGSTILNDQMPSPIFSGSALTTDGTYVYATHGGNNTTFWRFHPGAVSGPGTHWTALDPAPGVFSDTCCFNVSTSNINGGDLTYLDPDGTPGNGDEEIWAVPGNGWATSFDNDAVNTYRPAFLLRYAIATNTWPHESELTSPATSFPNLVYGDDGDSIYIFDGANTLIYSISKNDYISGNFGKLDDLSETWLANNSAQQGDGNSIVEANGKLYILVGFNTSYPGYFYEYNPATNRMKILDRLPAKTTLDGFNSYPGAGAALVKYDNDTIYAFQGNGTPHFWQYKISRNGWTQMAGLGSGVNVTYGGALAYPGGNFIYGFRGGATSTMYKYCTDTTSTACTYNTWATVTYAGSFGNVTGGAAMTSLGGEVYAVRGGNTQNFDKFTITNNPANGDGTWSAVSTPAFGRSATATAVINTDRFSSTSHGLVNGNTVMITSTGTMPGNVLRNTTYYVINATASDFQISLTLGGGAVDITSSGTGTIGWYATNIATTTGMTINNGASLTTDGVSKIYLSRGNGTGLFTAWDTSLGGWFPLGYLNTSTTTVMGSTSSSGAKGGIAYVATGPSGGAELFAVTGNGNGFASVSAVNGIIYRHPFTGTNANTWPIREKPASAPTTLGSGSDALLIPSAVSADIAYVLRGGTSQLFYAYDTSANTWTTLASAPATITGGGSLTTDGIDSIYATRGSGTNEVWRYCYKTGPNCTSSNVWYSTGSLDIPDAPVYFGKNPNGSGSDRGNIIYIPSGPSGGAELWATSGFASRYGYNRWAQDIVNYPANGFFFRYPFTGAQAGTWPLAEQPATMLPSTIGAGGHFIGITGPYETANGSIYAFNGAATNNFWKYSITNSPFAGDGTWTTLTSPTWAGTVSNGGSLTTDGSGTKIWAAKGNNSANIARYDITGAGTGTWTNLADAPANIGVTTNGGEIQYYNNKLWAVTGNGTSDASLSTSTYVALMYLYDIATNTWPSYVKPADAPTGATYTYGSKLTSTPDALKIFALRGSTATPTVGTPNLWRYDVSGTGAGLWTALTNMPNNTTPVNITTGGSIVAVANDLLYAFRGGNRTDFYKYTPSTDTWTVQSPMLSGVGAFSSSEDRGELIYSPTFGVLFAITGNDTSSPGIIYRFPLNRLTIQTADVIKTGGGTPEAGVSMDITVRVLDPDGNPYNVPANVSFVIGLESGTGNLSGSLTGTIPNGQSSATVTGVFYNRPETIKFNITDISVGNSFTLLSSASDWITIGTGPLTLSGVDRSSGPTAQGTTLTVNGINITSAYSKAININNGGSELTNYQLLLVLDTKRPVTEGKMRDDCADIRFTSGVPTNPYGASVGQLDYYLEGNCNSTDTRVWVEIPTIPAGSSSIYLNYGDTSLASASNGDNTFTFFDDFTGTTINATKWIEMDTTSDLVYQNDRLFLNAATSGGYGVMSNVNFDRATAGADFVGEFTVNQLNNTTTNLLTGWKNNTTSGTTIPQTSFIHGMNINGAGSTDYYEYSEAGALQSSGNSTYSRSWISNQPYRVRIRPKQNAVGAVYERSDDFGRTWYPYQNTTTANTNVSPLRIAFSSISGPAVEIDNVFVRKYAPTEPTLTYGAETPLLRTSIDGVNANVYEVSSSAIKLHTPAHVAGGPFDISITRMDGQNTSLLSSYTFNNPDVTLISPNSGPDVGGQSVTITGTDFKPWFYKRKIDITNAGAANLTNYPVPITIDTAAIIGEGKMRPDGGEIRFFANEDLTGEITNFWIEGPMNSASTKIWVKVPSLPLGATTSIYMAYGDLSLTAPATAIPSNVFTATGLNVPNKASYHFEESSGTGASDTSGNGNNGIAYGTNASSHPAGKFGNGRQFNGTDDYVEVPDDPSLRIGNEILLEAWVYMGASEARERTIVSKSAGPACSGTGFELYLNTSNQPVFRVAQNSSNFSSITGSSALSPGQWYHLVGVYTNANSMTLYRNGLNVASTAAGANLLAPTTAPLTIGRHSSSGCGRYFNGYIDDVRVYSKTWNAQSFYSGYQVLTTPQYPNWVLIKAIPTGVNPEPSVTVNAETGWISTNFDVNAATVTDADATSVSVTTPAHAPGLVDVTVTNVDSNAALETNGYTYSGPPIITLPLIPASGVSGTTVTGLMINGSNFAPGITVTFSKVGETDITCGNVSLSGSTLLTCDLNLSGAAIGFWDVTLENPDLQSDTETGAFEVTPGPADPTNSTVNESPSTVMANGVNESTVTVTLRDAGNNPTPGKVVTLAKESGDPGNPVIEAVWCQHQDYTGVVKGTTNSNGQACFNIHSEDVTSPVADTFIATDVTDGNIVITDTADVVFTVDYIDETASTFTALPATLEANGTDQSTLTVTLKDAWNHFITGKTVPMTDDGNPGNIVYDPVSQSEATNGSGVADFVVSTIVAGTYNFSATIPEPRYWLLYYDENTVDTTVYNKYTGTSGATLIPGTSGDDVSASYTLPFNFALFDQTPSTTVYVCSNGFVSTTNIGCPGSGSLSNAAAGFFRDLDTTAGGIYAENATDGNSTRFVWDAIDIGTGNPVDFEIIIAQNGRVEYHYRTHSGLTGRIGLYDSAASISPDKTSAFDNAAFSDAEATKFTYQINEGVTTVTFGPEQVQFTAGAVSPGNSSVTASPGSVEADGIQTSTITVTLRDSNNNPVPLRDVELSDDGTPGDVDYVGYATPPPYPTATTDGNGEVIILVRSTMTGTYTFTATDITGTPLTIGTAPVEFTCVLDANQQCIQIDITPGSGVLTLTGPDDFSFGTFDASENLIDLFSVNAPAPGYAVDVNDLVSVTDTASSGGFTLQLQTSAFEDPSTLVQLPLTNFFVVTKASNTGGIQLNGVEYPAGYVGVTNITAPVDTAGSFTDRATYTTDGSSLDQIIDLMLAPVTVIEGGRNGTFKQNVQYHLRIPAFTLPGNYAVTLTFDLARTPPV